jgi:hypothetical protein
LVLLLALTGCARSRWTSAEVEGKVLLGQMPLSGVKVVFYPESAGSEQLPYAAGLTDESGAYALTLPNGKAGAVVGKNRVVINYPVPERHAQAAPPSPTIPLRYTVAETALVVEVKDGERQVINLNLDPD